MILKLSWISQKTKGKTIKQNLNPLGYIKVRNKHRRQCGGVNTNLQSRRLSVCKYTADKD